MFTLLTSFQKFLPVRFLSLLVTDKSGYGQRELILALEDDNSRSIIFCNCAQTSGFKLFHPRLSREGRCPKAGSNKDSKEDIGE